jgi:hypothetical protein
MRLQESPHWLWLIDRADTPWYPTLRLFRSSGSDWDSAFDAASAELMELARTRWRQPAASARPSAVAANY